MNMTSRIAAAIAACERALETPRGRKAFWVVVAALFLVGGFLAVLRAEFPRKWLVDNPKYASPVDMGESKDSQAEWRSSEFRGFRQIGYGVMLEDRDPYILDTDKGLQHVRAYPPFFAMFFLPFAVLWKVPGLGSGLFYAIGFGLTLLSAWYLSRWARKPPEPDEDEPQRDEGFGRFALLFLLLVPLALNVMIRCETDMYILFPLALAFYLLVHRRHETLAGALLGIAACIKVLPGLFGVYFIFTRRWRALGGMVAVGVLCMGILPLLIWGPARCGKLYGSWANVVVGPYFDKGATSFVSGYRISNQSVTSALHRWLDQKPLKAGETATGFEAARPTAQTVSRVVKLLQLGTLLVLIVLWVTRGGRGEPATIAALLATVPCGILILSEVSLTTHHVTLMLPMAAILVRWERFRDDRASRWLWLLPVWLIALILSGVAKPVAPLLPATILFLIACAALAAEDRAAERNEETSIASTLPPPPL